MKRVPIVLAALALFPAAATAQIETTAERAPRARVEILAVVAEFGDALERADSAAALSLLHPNVIVYEGGHAETLDQYRSDHLGADMTFSAAVERETIDEQVVVGYDMATYLSEYITRGTYGGREIDSHGTETMVLVPTADGWKIRHIHWSSR